jgi:hypothetical protein
LQFFPAPKAELFFNTLYYQGDAIISDLSLNPSEGPGQGAGLNFDLLSDNLAQFSNLDVQRYVIGFGLNYSFTEAFLLSALLEYNRYDDNTPYLFDTTGRYTRVGAGINWLF